MAMMGVRGGRSSGAAKVRSFASRPLPMGMWVCGFRMDAFRLHPGPERLCSTSAATNGCLCVVTAAATSIGLGIRGKLIDENLQSECRATSVTDLIPRATVMQSSGPLSEQISRIAEIVPWLAHNALVHYLSPRGLEQYSGGGWGTCGVWQGPGHVG